MRRAFQLALPLALAIVWPGAPVPGQLVRALPPSEYMLERNREIALARSAGPASISADATIFVLTPAGEYEPAVAGINGWNCLVGRGWTGPAPVRDGRRVLGPDNFSPSQVGPQCFNPIASESVLQWHLMTTRLFLQGEDTETVEDRVQAALETGELSVPDAGAMAYMLSPDQYLNERVGRWHPHFMFYTPYADGRELFGTTSITTDAPFVTDSGGPWAITTVVAPRFSDGTPAPHIR